MKPEPEHYPDVVISGSLAMALVDVVEYARHRTHEAEDTARAELDAMADALDVELRDAAPPLVASGSVQSFEITSHSDEANRWMQTQAADMLRRAIRNNGRRYLR